MQKKDDVPMAKPYGEQTIRVVIGKIFYWHVMKEDRKHFVHTYVKC
jgi:hypothetical protein